MGIKYTTNDNESLKEITEAEIEAVTSKVDECIDMFNEGILESVEFVLEEKESYFKNVEEETLEDEGEVFIFDMWIESKLLGKDAVATLVAEGLEEEYSTKLANGFMDVLKQKGVAGHLLAEKPRKVYK